MSLPLPDGEPSDLDAVLVARTVGGDRDALGLLYQRYAGRLTLLAARLLCGREDAEDVVQDLFVGLPETLAGYRDQGRLEGWLRRATVNLALKRLRTASRRREEDLLSTTPCSPVSADSDAILVRRAVESLPDSLRAVVILKVVEGYSHTEIGELLGISRGASEVRLTRALEKLRQRIGE